MCLICIDFQREKMTPFEARRALGEMREGLDREHIREVERMIRDRERQEKTDKPSPSP